MSKRAWMALAILSLGLNIFLTVLYSKAASEVKVRTRTIEAQREVLRRLEETRP